MICVWPVCLCLTYCLLEQGAGRQVLGVAVWVVVCVYSQHNPGKSYKNKYPSCIILHILLNIHPLVVIPTTLLGIVLSLLGPLGQLDLELSHGLVDFLIDHLPFWIAFDVVLAEGVLAQLIGRIGQQVDCLRVVVLALVQFLQHIDAVLELPDLHQQLRALGHQLVLVLLSLFQDGRLYQQQLVPGHVVLVFLYAAVCDLQVNVHAGRVDCLPFLQHLGALCFHFLKGDIGQVCQADLGNTGIGLSNVSLDFWLWSRTEERIGQAFLSSRNALLENSNGGFPTLNFGQLKVPLISAIRVALKRSLQQLLGLIRLIIMLKYIGIAHDNHVIMRLLVIGQGVVVLGLFVVHLIVFLLAQLEELLEGERTHVFVFLHC